MLKIDTPSNIDSMSSEEILDICSEGRYVLKKEKRIELIKFFYEVLKFDLPNDLLLALTDESMRQLLLAPAGGGKTTTVASKLSIEKLIRRQENGRPMVGERMLCLVYNSHNVDDFKNRHAEIISKLKRSGMGGISHLDSNIECRTIHSFCQMWITQEEYEAKVGIKGYKLIDSASDNTLNVAIEKVFKKNNLGLPTRDLCGSILSLYNYLKETMVTLEDVLNTDKFTCIGQPYDIVKSIIDLYAMIKKMQRRYDFTDILVYFNDFIKKDKEFRERIQGYYKYVTADEVQDFTPIMRSILHSIVGENTPLTCIGDDDQAIYQFRGADNDTVLNFQKIFEDSKVYLLKTNRRCPKNVITLADTVIRFNQRRFGKEIIGVKPDGEIDFVGYNDKFGQYHAVMNVLSSMTSEERSRTVVAYREKNSSLAMSHLIYNKRMSQNVLSGYRPFQYGLWYAVEDVLKAIRSKNNKRLMLNLYKVLPVTKGVLIEALGYDVKTKEFKNGENYVDIGSIEFPSMSKGAKDIYNYIVLLSKYIDDKPLKEYFPTLLGLIYKHYWNNILRNSSFGEFDAFQREQIVKFYCGGDSTAYEKSQQLEDARKSLERDQYGKNGITLSTFHSLKGLEFDTVILLDLDESIFPQTSRIDAMAIDEESKTSLKECETRLLYVAITRTKKKLMMYYNKSNPSIYINMLINNDYSTKEELKSSMSAIEFDEPGFELGSSKVSFNKNKKKDLFGRLK